MKYLLTNQESERLTFRKLQNSDFESWLDLFYDDEVAQLLGMSEFRTPNERCERWFEWTFHRYKNNLGGQNVLLSKSNNEIIGQCGILVREVDHEKELEIAYSILSNHRQKGYATEAAKKCRDFAFENNFYKRLVSIIIPENQKSKNVALKNGMKFNRIVQFQNKKMELFQIEKEEWENLHSSSNQ